MSAIIRTSSLLVCMVITYSRVWINRVWLPILLVVSSTGKTIVSLFPFAHENLASGDGFGRPVPRQSGHSLHSHSADWLPTRVNNVERERAYYPSSKMFSLLLLRPKYWSSTVGHK